MSLEPYLLLSGAACFVSDGFSSIGCLFRAHAGTKETVKNALSRWGRKVGEATRKAEDLSRNTWQHCG